MTNISMKSLLEAGVHFGHKTRAWNPKMAKYIYGARNDIHIIDLSKTVKELKKALKFLKDCSLQDKVCLFVGTTKQSQESILEASQRCGSPFVNQRWLGGTLTNFSTVRRSVERLKEIEKMKTDKILNYLPKKEAAQLEKLRLRLEKSLCGIKDMPVLPDILFVIDPMAEMTAVMEAKKLEIPIVAVCDTNCNSDLIDYPIPGNDDAVRSVKLFCTYAADAILEGRAEAEKLALEQAAPKEGAVSAPAEEANLSGQASGEVSLVEKNIEAAPVPEASPMEGEK